MGGLVRGLSLRSVTLVIMRMVITLVLSVSTSGGGIEIVGGGGSAAYGMIGHGDRSSAGGNRTGDIFVGAEG